MMKKIEEVTKLKVQNGIMLKWSIIYFLFFTSYFLLFTFYFLFFIFSHLLFIFYFLFFILQRCVCVFLSSEQHASTIGYIPD